jgi:hypothetical protein
MTKPEERQKALSRQLAFAREQSDSLFTLIAPETLYAHPNGFEFANAGIEEIGSRARRICAKPLCSKEALCKNNGESSCIIHLITGGTSH